MRNQIAQPLPTAQGQQEQGESQQDNQGQHISQMEQAISPIKLDKFDLAKDYTTEKHDNFISNLESDPAVQEYSEDFHTYLETLNQGVQSGQLTQDEALQYGHDYIQNVVKPVIEKHHKGSTAKGLHAKPEPEIPE
ncbi:hypothetical protein, partial [Herbiconiux daphne]